MKQGSIIDKIKPEVRAISAYTLKEYDYEIKINQNENPGDVPEDIKREILDEAMKTSWSRYPAFVPNNLLESLTEYTGWTSDGILAGNGSNELIQALITVFLGPGSKLVLPSPTFTVYKLVGSVLGADVVEIPLNADYSYDCDALEAEFLDGGDMLIICSPNNPTGSLYPADRLEKLLAKTDSPVIVDEAYFEFSGVTAAGLLEKFDNLVVLRTFSKAFSLAGFRVGYGLMNPLVAKEAGKAKLPYNLDFLSLVAAVKLLGRRDALQDGIDRLIRERDAMIPAMNEIEGVKAYPSSANFILFETTVEPKTVFEGMLADGLLIRDVSSYPMLGKALRVTVSFPEDNRRFLDTLKRIMQQG